MSICNTLSGQWVERNDLLYLFFPRIERRFYPVCFNERLRNTSPMKKKVLQKKFYKRRTKLCWAQALFCCAAQRKGKSMQWFADLNLNLYRFTMSGRYLSLSSLLPPLCLSCSLLSLIHLSPLLSLISLLSLLSSLPLNLSLSLYSLSGLRRDLNASKQTLKPS